MEKVTEENDKEILPGLVLEENKLKEITIDFSQTFPSWTDNESGKIKKIIPVTVNGHKMSWWLNVRNPIYADILRRGTEGQTVFKILQTGDKQKTKYSIVEEEIQEA